MSDSPLSNAFPSGPSRNLRPDERIQIEYIKGVDAKLSTLGVKVVKAHDIDKTFLAIRLAFQLAGLVMSLFRGKGFFAIIGIVTTSWSRISEIVSLSGQLWDARQELIGELQDIDAQEAAQIFEKISLKEKLYDV